MAGVLFVTYSIVVDVDATVTKVTSYLPCVFVSLLIALGFQFVNGFHDTANAVATVFLTNPLPAEFAVMWSGLFNFLGMLAYVDDRADQGRLLCLQGATSNAVYQQPPNYRRHISLISYTCEGRRGSGRQVRRDC